MTSLVVDVSVLVVGVEVEAADARVKAEHPERGCVVRDGVDWFEVNTHRALRRVYAVSSVNHDQTQVVRIAQQDPSAPVARARVGLA